MVATLRSTMPVQQIHRISLPSWRRWRRIVRLVGRRVPTARACPTTSWGADPVSPRAARRDSRCDGVGDRYQYFGAWGRPAARRSSSTQPRSARWPTSRPRTPTGPPPPCAGNVVVDDPRHLDSGRVTLAITTVTSSGDKGTTRRSSPASRPASAAGADHHDDQADRPSLGLDSVAAVALATTSRVPTVAEEDRLRAALGSQLDKARDAR